MKHLLVAAQIVAGIVAGGLMTWAYFHLLRKQVARITDDGMPVALLGLGYLMRLALFGGVLALLLWLNFRAAGLAYALTFLVARGVALKRYNANQKPPEGSAD